MIMADVFAVFGTLLAVGIALPGLLLTWRLLLPNIVERAQQRLTQTPWTCFFVGAGCLIVYLVPVLILFNLPWAGFKATGFVAALLLVILTSVGAAGLAGLMGDRLQRLGFQASPAGATIRGAVALELAAAFPLIGWFIFIPLTFILVLGAALFALLRWRPRQVTETPASSSPEDSPASTLIRQRLVIGE